MKNLILLFALCCFFSSAFSQEKEINESDVPKVVVDAFYAKYSGAVTSVWIQGTDNYEVTFVKDDVTLEANYSYGGEWIETSKDFDFDKFPDVVKRAFAIGKYGKWNVEKSAVVETPDYKLLYMIEVSKGKKSYELYYSPDGELLKKE